MTTETIPLDDETGNTAEKYAAAKKSTWVSVWVNICLTIGQIITGIFAQSQAMISDGIHSFSDLIADFVVLIANRHSQKAADEDHHYGHQRYETAASLVLGCLLLAVGAGMVWSAIVKFENIDAIPEVHSIALWVAGIALIAKESLFRYMLSVATRVKSSMLVANAWHARSDAASSLVVGVGIIGNLLGYRILDPIAAMIVGLMVFKMGWGFTWDALHDLMDRAVDEDEIEKIKTTIASTPGISGFHDLKTRKMGDMILVDVHLEVNGQLTVEQGHDIALEARKRVMASKNILNVMTHVDPV